MWKIRSGMGLILILLLLATVVLAQEEVGGGGGPALGWLFLDLSSLDEALVAHSYAPLGNGTFIMGGGGFGGEMSGWRFGGFGRGWGISSTQGEKKAELDIGYGGFAVEYARPLSEKMMLSLGGLIGGGGADLSLLDHRSESFDEAISEPTNTSLERLFLALEPYVSLEFQLLEFLRIRLMLGYFWTPLLSDWIQDEKWLPGPPEEFSAPTICVQFAFVGFETLEEE